MAGQPGEFYVYRHRMGTVDGSIFYIGKGKGRRAWSLKSRTAAWHAVVAKHGFVAEVVARELTEDRALQLEAACIASAGLEVLVNGAVPSVEADPALVEEWSHVLWTPKRHFNGRQDMSVSVQQRGLRFQLRVKHKLLHRPFFATFKSHDDALAYGQQLSAMLKNGIVPSELAAPAVPSPSVDQPIMAVVRGYLAKAGHLTPSDDKLLASMLDELGPVKLGDVNYKWAGEWVRRMKVERGLAPGTIRKRVGVLARVLDWHLAIHAAAAAQAPVNPLRLMPSGYAQYTQAERQLVEARGHAAKVDVRRDRRLLPAEEAAVRQALAGEKRPDRERPWTGPAGTGPDPAFDLFFSVIVDTGLRLREAYRLRVDQVDTDKGFIRVEGSKGTRGLIKPRVVPLKRPLREALASWCAGRVGLLWPYWNGTPEDLDPATRRLSARFATLFRYAGVQAMTEHDLRHEATCRWFELRDAGGRWVFSDLEIARIMGWSNLSMALRYASLRGEDLAARLG